MNMWKLRILRAAVVVWAVLMLPWGARAQQPVVADGSPASAVASNSNGDHNTNSASSDSSAASSSSSSPTLPIAADSSSAEAGSISADDQSSSSQAAQTASQPSTPDNSGHVLTGNFFQRLAQFYKQDWAGTNPSAPAVAKRGLPAPLSGQRR